MQLYVTHQRIQSVSVSLVDTKKNGIYPHNNVLELLEYPYALFSAVRHLPGDPDAVNQFWEVTAQIWQSIVAATKTDLQIMLLYKTFITPSVHIISNTTLLKTNTCIFILFGGRYMYTMSHHTDYFNRDKVHARCVARGKIMSLAYQLAARGR